MAEILINSILGGHSAASNFAAKDQFRTSLGIDPSLPLNDNLGDILANSATGLLRPSSIFPATGTLGKAVRWLTNSPKTTMTFVVDMNSSLYALNVDAKTFSAIADAGEFTSGATQGGQGSEYYDNFLYVAKDTDIGRYGPLNASDCTFNGSFWSSTLGKGALNFTTAGYPSSPVGIQYPQHVMHRHSDGKLYFADVSGGQGVIHYISTKKTTFEGDTDNGSTAAALTFGFGLFPTSIESYGTSLAIALYEGGSPAKLAFWDTTSQNFNSITWVEFPDPVITALKNVDGVLYIASSNVGGWGFRVSRYVGGNSIEEVAYVESGSSPTQAAMAGTAKRLVFGSNTSIPANAATVYSLGLQQSNLSKGLFSILSPLISGAGNYTVTALSFPSSTDATLNFFQYQPVIAWGSGTGTTTGIGIPGKGAYDATSSINTMWWSQMYKIGQPFQIKRIRIPLAQTLGAGMSIVPTLFFDNGIASQALTTINSTNFSNTAETGFGRVANIRLAGDGTNIMRGQTNFWLELKWGSTGLCIVDLPILIEFDVVPD